MRFLIFYLKSFFLVLLFFLFDFSSFCHDTVKINLDKIPEINSISHSDVVFNQFLKTLEYNDKQVVLGGELIQEFYKITIRSNDSVVALASDLQILPDNFSSLNSIFAHSNLCGKTLVLFTVKGVFVPMDAMSAFEIILKKEFENDLEEKSNVQAIYEYNGRKFFFIPGKRFSLATRAFFLDSSFSLPLDTKIVSSGFGFRNSPVYSTWKKHNGIDFAAPEGDNVYACKTGVVKYIFKNDKIFGNYVIILHSNNLTSVYAHLSKVQVSENQKVFTGQKIGEVGQTGVATGPHLHFEIRQNGKAKNPMEFIN